MSTAPATAQDAITREAEIATSRFGLGARPGEIEAARKEPRAWLRGQLGAIEFTSTAGDSFRAQELYAAHLEYRRWRRRAAGQDKAAGTADAPEAQRRELNALGQTLARDTLAQAISSQRPLAFRLLDFFSNHFSVSGNGIRMRGLAPTLEREAIAPWLEGRFEDMLLAVTRHPAMLLYLNNAASIGPDSGVGRRRSRGLNENLAREILELHTLGVHGGYDQADVRELALAITGWSVGRPERKETPGFVFRNAAHQPGKRSLLGKSYAVGGVGQGERMLRDLARHEATASHICFKLARHFIADDPPPALTAALERTWQANDGALGAVVAELVNHRQSWELQQRKLKTPREFVISTFRAAALDPRRFGALPALGSMGQRPFAAGSPAGYSDSSEAWDGAQALMTRIDWADAIADRIRAEPRKLADSALGGLLREDTARLMGGAESRSQAIVLLLMSPEFQRR